MKKKRKPNWVLISIIFCLILLVGVGYFFQIGGKIDSDLQYQTYIEGLRVKVNTSEPIFYENPQMNLTISPEVAIIFYTSNGLSKARQNILICNKLLQNVNDVNMAFRFNEELNYKKLYENVLEYGIINYNVYMDGGVIGQYPNGSNILNGTLVYEPIYGWSYRRYDRTSMFEITIYNGQRIYYVTGVDFLANSCRDFDFEYIPANDDDTMKWDAYLWLGTLQNPTYSLLLDPNWVLESSAFQIETFSGAMQDDGQNLSLDTSGLSGYAESVRFCPNIYKNNWSLADWNVPYSDYGVAQYDTSDMHYYLQMNETGQELLLENITNIGWAHITDAVHNTTNCIFGNCVTNTDQLDGWRRTTPDDDGLENTNLSVEAWVKSSVTSTVQDAAIWSMQSDNDESGVQFYAYSVNGFFSVYVYGSSTELVNERSSVNISDMEWHHIYGVVGTSGVELSIDGNLVHTNAGEIDLPVSDSYETNLIGNYKNSFVRGWQGNIDEVVIRSGADAYLTTSEVMERFKEGVVKYDISVKFFDENASASAMPYNNISILGATQKRELNESINCIQYRYYGYKINLSVQDPYLISINFSYHPVGVPIGAGNLNATNLRIYTTEGTNYTDEDILVSFIPISTNETEFIGILGWFENGTLQEAYTGLIMINNTETTHTLKSGNTTRYDNWTAQIVLQDSFTTSAGYTTQLIILNSPPTTPNIDEPINNTIYGNNTITLGCSGSTDLEGDTINYEFWADQTNPPTTIQQNLTQTIINYNFNLGDGDYWWRCRTNDNQSVSSYNYTRKIEVDRRLILTNITSFNDSILEGTTQIFRLNITKNNLTVSDIDSEFIYNNISYVATKLQESYDRISFYSSFIIPSVPADPTVNSLNWNLSITQSNGTLVYNTTFAGEQTVSKLFLDNCSIYGTVIFNFTLLDEETQVKLNGTMETAFNLYTSDRNSLIANLSDTYININPLKICMSKNLTATNEYSLDTIVRYEAPDNANEYYNIINFILDNDTETQNIFLYDLNLTDSTEFQLTFTGSNFLPVENALVYVDRQYIAENTFKTVELPKTDNNGQTILHLVRNEIIYNIRIIKDGIILGNFENIVAFCDDYSIGDCKIILNAFESGEGIFIYDEYMGITFTEPEYDEITREVSFTFLTVGGTVKTVQMDVTRSDIFGNRSVCSDTLMSSGGTLMCFIPSYIDESTLYIDIFVEGDLVIVDTIRMDTSNYGYAGYLIFFIMALSIILLFSGSKTGILVGIVISFVAAVMFGLISSSLIGLGASGMWLIIIVLIGIYKLNKGREQ